MAPAENKNKKHINDIVTGAYNSARNFCIDNKGILINCGLGIAQIAAGAKGIKYARELNQPLFSLGCYVLFFRGYLDVVAGIFRIDDNMKINDDVNKKIKEGSILLTKKEEEIESRKMYRNNEILVPEEYFLR
ncbi:hypothetical protein COY26_02540 [Candidatus Woesearchaeota archaeon CG_4_10_14_0_2_um_filter_33_10]|nr:MAG: hypothetical protein COV14_05770 [Candidatus Woesearchaeota archaeon CG10_big_fil_rev_8_21_14_0_10_33_12]PIU73111.1 MAG: hypothetical protein COS79_00130 [Candidatus Woesearchaeota archaeon CG06_land_8_20_14_3_00_33_13]PIZ53242.1 MAG: hypothetical protein COY26_02540 [Candidatus Woesearchaeota archaeon CG_4_10_14_0_2_um_filter_33_10]